MEVIKMSQENSQFAGKNGNANGTTDFLGYWQSTFNTLTWNQEQVEKFFEKLTDQQKLNREDAKQVIQEMVTQAKKNQEQLLKLIKEAVQGSFAAVVLPTQSQITELSKKIDELTQKLENR